MKIFEKKSITDQRISNSIGVSFVTRWGVGSTDFLRNAIAFAKVSIWLIAILGLIALAVIRPFGKKEIANIDSKGKNIICFGDSLTAGYNAAPDESYPSVLSAMLARPVINAGVDGDTAQTALTRLEQDVLAKDPLLVIVILGANDFLDRRPIEETMEDLRTIINKIHQRGAMVAIGQLGPSTMHTYKDDYQRIAEQENALLIESILGGIYGNPQLMSDHVHPNAEGYAKIAHKVYKAVNPLLESNQNKRRDL